MFALANETQSVVRVLVNKYTCVKCYYSWVGRKETEPKLCPSCRQAWEKPNIYKVTTKTKNHPYISNREQSAKKVRRLYPMDSDEARRDETIRAIASIPTNNKRVMPCFALFEDKPDYPPYDPNS